MAIIQIPSVGNDWQLSYKVPYSSLVGGFTDVFEAPDGAILYDISYQITNGGGTAQTIQMMKSDGNAGNLNAIDALWFNIGSAVAVGTVGNSFASAVPMFFRFQIGGSPAAGDIIQVQMSFD